MTSPEPLSDESDDSLSTPETDSPKTATLASSSTPSAISSPVTRVADDWKPITVWNNWNHIASAASITGSVVWHSWNNQFTGNTIAYNPVPIYNARDVEWMHTTSRSTISEYFGDDDPIVYRTWGGWNNTYQETADQAARREELERIHRAQMEARRQEMLERRARTDAERKEAEDRARQLFRSMLSAQQKRDVLEHGWFEVISNLGRRWRIRVAEGIYGNYSGNVDLMSSDLTDGERLASYCAHGGYEAGGGVLPPSDHWLLQKLVLESDEAKFTAVANVHHIRPGLTRNDLAA